jgi:hypothetical protein
MRIAKMEIKVKGVELRFGGGEKIAKSDNISLRHTESSPLSTITFPAAKILRYAGLCLTQYRGIRARAK